MNAIWIQRTHSCFEGTEVVIEIVGPTHQMSEADREPGRRSSSTHRLKISLRIVTRIMAFGRVRARASGSLAGT